MYIRALLVIASGFIFIFSPGLPMSLISRYHPDYKRDLVYWGLGAWLIANLINQFSSILLRQYMYRDAAVTGFASTPLDFAYIFLSALISAIILGLFMLLVLRIKSAQQPLTDLAADGLALGFGTGLIAQVFTGITLVGAGFQVLFGNTSSNITIDAIANSNALVLFASILTLILFRIALLAVSAVQGVLTACSFAKKKGAFWIGVIVMALFTAIILSLQLLMGGSDAGQVTVGITPAPVSIVTGLYYLLTFVAAYYWLVKTFQIKK